MSFCLSAFGQEKSIQDNSFLIEEAYNQEPRVVQHINTFTRMWNSKDWNYSFTQEWPMPHAWRNQLSYTLVGSHIGAFDNSGAGLGDLMINYRYQIIGDGESRIAFAPRLSLMVPTGDTQQARGAGSIGYQTNLPVSIAHNSRVTTHWNAGATFIPHAKSLDGDRAPTVGYNIGNSVIFGVSNRFNVLVETVHSQFQCVTGPGQTEWATTTLMSPGIRWAHNFPSGLQIVPGLAMPIGIASTMGEKGVFVYLSFEHPYPNSGR